VSSTTPTRPRLSPRQREVIELAARGLTNQEIARVLEISAATVHAHLSAAYAALEVTNRTEAAAVFLSWQTGPEPPPPAAGQPAIAVLPVLSLDGGRDGATMAGGMTRDLVAQLSGWRWLPVIDAGPVSDVRKGTLREIGARLGARYLVDASLQRRGDRWRLNTQVSDAATGHCLFADVQDFPAGEPFDAQDAAIASVVARVYPHVAGAAQAEPGPALAPLDLEPTLVFAHYGPIPAALDPSR
jgi:TolB-like protein